MHSLYQRKLIYETNKPIEVQKDKVRWILLSPAYRYMCETYPGVEWIGQTLWEKTTMYLPVLSKTDLISIYETHVIDWKYVYCMLPL